LEHKHVVHFYAVRREYSVKRVKLKIEIIN